MPADLPRCRVIGLPHPAPNFDHAPGVRRAGGRGGWGGRVFAAFPLPQAPPPPMAASRPAPAALPDSDTDRRHSLAEFVQAQTGQRDLGEGFFEMERDRLLEVNLGTGRQRGLDQGRGDGGLRRPGRVRAGGDAGARRGESSSKSSSAARGRNSRRPAAAGRVYLADQGKKVTVLYLNGESVFVNGNDLLAFEPSLTWDINIMRSLGAIAGGGLFNVKFGGTGDAGPDDALRPVDVAGGAGRPAGVHGPAGDGRLERRPVAGVQDGRAVQDAIRPRQRRRASR